MEKVWTRGFDDYRYWQMRDRKTVRKINALLRDIERMPLGGRGKVKALRGDWSGWFSRRIDSVNRLVYRIEAGHIEIALCRGHYSDK
jgi:toxin YoeB